LLPNSEGEQVEQNKIDPKFKAPTPEEAQNWFEQSFGKTHTFEVKVEESNQSFDSNSTTTPTIEVTPIWSNARISAYLSNHQVLMVPVNQIAALTKPRVGYCAVFYRDSVGQIAYTLQVLVPTQLYFSTHVNLSVSDFSGIFLQIRPNGKIKNTLGAENGRIVGSFDLPTGGNSLDPCSDCGDWDGMWRHIFDDLGVGLHVGWGYREFTINYGVDNYDPPTGTGGQYFFPPISDQIDNTLFDEGNSFSKRLFFEEKYIGSGGKLDADEFMMLYNNKRLFTAVERYARTRNHDAQAINVAREVTEEYFRDIPTSRDLQDEYYEDLTLYLKLQSESPEFVEFSQTLNSGIGSSGGPLKAILLDLLVDAAQEWAENFLGINDLTALRSLLERGIENSERIAFKATRIIARFIAKKNPIFNALSSFVKAKEVYEKVSKAYIAFDNLSKVGFGMIEKIATILKNDFGGILKNIKWKNQEWGAVMPNINPQTFWQKLRDAIPGGTYSIGHNPQNPLEQTWKFSNPNILFKFYPGSNTTSNAGFPNCYTLDITSPSSTFKIRFCE
jgi:hypothetical protein